MAALSNVTNCKPDYQHNPYLSYHARSEEFRAARGVQLLSSTRR